LKHSIVKTEIKGNNGAKKQFTAGEVDHTPVVIFSAKAFATIREIVKSNSTEVGWYGIVKTEENIVRVNDIVYPKQKLANHGTCEFDEGDAIETAVCKPGGVENVANLKFWGHSHHTMAVSPSGQDEQQAMHLATRSDSSGLFVRGIFNKHGDVGLSVFCGSTLRRWDKVGYIVEGDLATTDEDLSRMMSILSDDSVSLFKKRDAISQLVFESESAIVEEIDNLNKRNVSPSSKLFCVDTWFEPQVQSNDRIIVDPTYSESYMRAFMYDDMSLNDLSDLVEMADDGDPLSGIVLKMANESGMADRILGKSYLESLKYGVDSFAEAFYADQDLTPPDEDDVYAIAVDICTALGMSKAEVVEGDLVGSIEKAVIARYKL